MEQETFKRLKKDNGRVKKQLCDEYLPCCWFIAYYMTEDSAVAAPMVINAFKNVFDRIQSSKDNPEDTFMCLLSSELYDIYKTNPPQDSVFEKLPPARPDKKYCVLTDNLTGTDRQKRIYYLLTKFGDMSAAKLGEKSGNSQRQVREWSQSVSSQLIGLAKKKSRLDRAALVRLDTEFSATNLKDTAGVEAPQFLKASLAHALSIEEAAEEQPKRKEVPTVNSSPTVSRKKRNAKIRKTIIISVIVSAVIVVGAIAIKKYSDKNSTTSEITTTYLAEAITYGDVDTTISGSGTLTPVTNETLSCENPCTVDEVNVSVGDSVEEGDVIATVTQTVTTTTVDEETREMTESTSEEEVEITAPCDGIVTELPVAEGDSLEANGEIAIVMGTDGFVLELSVDEDEIANISVGQEVEVTVDAVNGDYTGEVTNLSYNGSTNGSSTSYQITAKIDYEEGIYSGMSASAEIVIESSGDGLLVPVDAVKTSGDDSYVTLAPSGAEDGTSYNEDELDEDSLTTVTVETGMSDGTYIMIESDELEEGDIIIVKQVSTTAEPSDSGSDTQGFGGMDMGNMDMGDFDPTNLPDNGGQMPTGMGGGNGNG